MLKCKEGGHDILLAGLTLIKFNRMISERRQLSYIISAKYAAQAIG